MLALIVGVGPPHTTPPPCISPLFFFLVVLLPAINTPRTNIPDIITHLHERSRALTPGRSISRLTWR